MSNKKLGLILLGIAAAVIAGFGLYKLLNKSDKASVSTNSTRQTETAPSTNSSQQSQAALTKEEVAKHNSKDDCWTIIEGSVYDLTSFIPSHPGGDEILRACGIDGTSLFTERTTSSGQEVGSGTPHSSSAQAQLDELKLGPLQQ